MGCFASISTQSPPFNNISFGISEWGTRSWTDFNRVGGTNFSEFIRTAGKLWYELSFSSVGLLPFPYVLFIAWRPLHPKTFALKTRAFGKRVTRGSSDKVGNVTLLRPVNGYSLLVA